uniref:Capsid protein n=1 Tax=uncultured marine virus TaxID=186617 RepID=A0A0F7LA00_9VIRU|nr:capsid protein [uncultured marine virus]
MRKSLTLMMSFLLQPSSQTLMSLRTTTMSVAFTLRNSVRLLPSVSILQP